MNDTGERVAAIIRRPRFGVTDRGWVMLSFDAYVSESSAALQILGPDTAVEVLLAYRVSDVSELEGKPCWVRKTANTITWDGAWKV